MIVIHCETRILKIGEWAVIRIPKEASAQLSSRGIVMIKLMLNKLHLQILLEPDGRGSHWFQLNDSILKDRGLTIGDTVKLDFEQSDLWTEPVLPLYLEEAFINEPLLRQTWQMLTSRAKWEWIRWIRSTKNEQTKIKRIAIAIDKLRNGNKRPCCFNSSLCTDLSVSYNGVLLDETYLV